ncbi:MAG: general secretion pathway protein GspK [Lysobacteraceae bacterium]|nr:MAG: general secretion pathway protein GspK [Xanthomonadaceae bacterium]
MTRARSATRQRGVGLLVVLVLLVVVSVLAVAMLDDIRFGLRRAGNARQVAQAQWHALGAEEVARQRLGILAGRDPGGTRASTVPAALDLPIEEDGTVRGRVRSSLADADTCFNLNSVVEGAGEQWQRSEAGVRQLLALLHVLGVDDGAARAFADTLVDWIDADQDPGARGAEDAAYLARDPAQLTSATLLAEPSELRALRGVEPGLYTALREYACALPVSGPSPIDVNALTAHDLPLLRMLGDGAIDASRARRILAARPATGWTSAEAFWAQPALAGFIPSAAVRQQVQVRGRYYRLEVAVAYDDALVELSSLLEADPSGRVRLLSRRWTREE